MKLQLYYPVKPLYINQKFGETAFLDYYKKNGIEFTGHNGIDLAAKHGQPIRASHDGWAYYEVDTSQGHGVVIRTDTPFEYETGEAYFKSIYWHMVNPVEDSKFTSPLANATPEKPVWVKAGDIIGYADSSGLSTGTHVHWGLKALVKEGETFYNLNQKNGMYGAIDPNPYLNGKFAEDINDTKHVFSYDLHFGIKSDEVKKLQQKLQKLGYFPKGQECTGNYFGLTQSAVYTFQLDYVPLSWYEKYWLRGSKCGQKTRAALNKLL
jgi:hypothetical protein